jgi:hypothetical protein
MTMVFSALAYWWISRFEKKQAKAIEPKTATVK